MCFQGLLGKTECLMTAHIITIITLFIAVLHNPPYCICICFMFYSWRNTANHRIAWGSTVIRSLFRYAVHEVTGTGSQCPRTKWSPSYCVFTSRLEKTCPWGIYRLRFVQCHPLWPFIMHIIYNTALLWWFLDSSANTQNKPSDY